MTRLKILTWHTHGSYLYYLTQAPHDFYVLSKPGRPPGYGGRHGHIPWGDNVIDLPAEQAKDTEFDCIVFQDDPQYLMDQYLYLTEKQRRLPRIYIEHDPPREHPTDMRHPVIDRNVMLVHVTHFNRLMWDNGDLVTRVIEHGVMVPKDVEYSGELDRGIVVVNNIMKRGRGLGGDIYQAAKKEVPIDLVGTGAEEAGGLGEVLYSVLPRFVSRYRYFFNPIRYAGMRMAVVEAMMIGVPIIGLATTEMSVAIENGVSGFVDTNVGTLVGRMKELLGDRTLARHLGQGARRRAMERFHIERFVRDWNDVFREVTS